MTDLINILESELNDRRREANESKEAGRMDLWQYFINRIDEIKNILNLCYKEKIRIIEGLHAEKESEFERTQREFESK